MTLIDDNISISKLLLCIHVPAGSGTPVHKNRRSHGFAYGCSGETNYVFDTGTHLTAKSGDIIYLPKHSNYMVKGVVLGDCYAINFDVADELDIREFMFHSKHPQELLKHFKKSESSWQKRNPGFYEECSAALYCILALMKREMSADYCPSSKLKLIQPALTYIKQNYTMETISVSHLAALCGISEVYLRKIFSGMFAVSPLQYVNQLKITRAKELLSSGLYSVAEAAEMSGFFDLSYFSREFKKATSLSPSEFKKGNHLSNM